MTNYAPAGVTVPTEWLHPELRLVPEIGAIRFYSEEDKDKFLHVIKVLLQERIDKLSLGPNDIIIVDNQETAEALGRTTNARYPNPIIVVHEGDVRTLTDEEVCQLLNRITT